MKITPRNAYSKVRVYSQDPAVAKTTEENVPKDSIGTKLSGPRMAIVTGRREFRARADKEGNYIYSPDNKRFNQVHAYVAAQKTLELFESFADRKLPWAFDSEKLGVIPHAGDGRNAYYARWNQSVSFYSFDSKSLKKRVHVAQSADVVSHETGHAILDGMKPMWGKTFDRETKGTHEAFADCAAMLLAVSRPESRAMALEQTGGDLRQNNLISSLAEEFGTAQRGDNRNPDDDKPYLRNSNNQFTYKPPSELPKNGPRDVLSAEPHSFCQIFTRAFYTAIVGVYEDLRSKGMEAEAALQKAGDITGGLLAKGITWSAPNRARFADVAKGMIRADRLEGGEASKALEAAFLKTEILTQADLEEMKKPLPQGDSATVLAELGLEDMSLDRTVTDNDGIRTLEFSAAETSTRMLDGAPVSIDTSAGASLTYDPQGELIHLAVLRQDPEAEWAGVPDSQALFSGFGPQNTAVVPAGLGYKLEPLPVFQD